MCNYDAKATKIGIVMFASHANQIEVVYNKIKVSGGSILKASEL